MVQFTQPDKLGKDMTQKTAIWNYLTDQIETCACEYSHIPLCNPHDRYVSDATAVTDIQPSQLGGWGTFSQALDPNITHPDTRTAKPLHHAMSWKGTQSKTTAATNTPTCYKVRCPGVAGSWGRPQIWGWRRSFWGTLRRGVCGGLVSCCTGPSSWCLSLGCYLKSEQRLELLLYFDVHMEMNVEECKMISPSVLKAFSLATSAMAFKATSERWGASSIEMAESERHLAISAC